MENVIGAGLIKNQLKNRGLMGMLSWLLPQEKHFFDMIENQSKNVLEGVDALVDMLEQYTDIDKKREKIKNIENNGDKMVHDIFAELNRTLAFGSRKSKQTVISTEATNNRGIEELYQELKRYQSNHSNEPKLWSRNPGR